MLLGPNKKMAQIIAGSMKKEPYQQKMGDGGMVEDSSAMDASTAKEAAAQKLISAIDSKDPKMLVSAMQNMMDLCSVSEPMEMDED